jgi:hypothetical protein
VYVAPIRGLLSHDATELDRIRARLGLEPQVLDDVLGGFGDDAPLVVEALASGAPADLVKVACAHDGGLLAVELAQLGEEDRADRDVHADAERVRAADDGEEPLLCEAFDEAAVLRQQPGVVDAEAVPNEARDVFAVGRVEAESRELGEDRLLLLFRREVDAHQILCELGRPTLREAHDVNGRFSRAHQIGNGFVERRLAVLEVERHGPLGRAYGDGLLARERDQSLFELVGRAERRAHQQKRGPLEDQKRHLPGDAALSIRVVVKLVHDDVVHRRVATVAKRHVREHLGRAADDGRVTVDCGVPREHADVFGTEVLAEREELLVHERLDRRRVEGAPSLSHGEKMHGERDQGLARACGRREDDVVSGEDLEQRLFLCWIERETDGARVPEKEIEQFVARRAPRWEAIGEGELRAHGFECYSTVESVPVGSAPMESAHSGKMSR